MSGRVGPARCRSPCVSRVRATCTARVATARRPLLCVGHLPCPLLVVVCVACAGRLPGFPPVHSPAGLPPGLSICLPSCLLIGLLTCLRALGLAPTRLCWHSLARDLVCVVSGRWPCLRPGHLPRPFVVAVRVACAGSSVAWVRLCSPVRRDQAAGRRDRAAGRHAACVQARAPGVRSRRWAVERRGWVGMCAPARGEGRGARP
ncbi:uncharacterized protein C8Q71DRAFT_733067 [Rhodofomes roseus]|uniref:Uncharacterized protein n=1 Tax=Rhodofomes roseus TaxID=34475 RepID=A0ABQ8KU43_9APHY|nr:uncharacterized protein C8Q71DRAFT_733067 [Rhodofomes roseus]KAH9842489.1 hypothetical protein C8Q71DRAFT_733067 [Rhodofomes roseus]